MNLTQALAAAAAALVTALSTGGATQAFAERATVAAQAALDRVQIRAAVEELAALMQQSYVFPDIAQAYADRLRARAEAGAYDGMTDPAQLADALEADLNGVHHDAHLRVELADGPPTAPRMVRSMPGEEAFGHDRWLADGVAYLRIDLLPGAEAAPRMAQILDRYADANTLILDLRSCRGGTLDVMDVLLSRLFDRPTEIMTMDTRTNANPQLEAAFGEAPTMHRSEAPNGVTRWVHRAAPAAQRTGLADARVYVLTDVTASACEHLALGLKHTGRATLVGATTRGAGHYGGERAFGDGRFMVWLPVGRSYVAETGQGWEGTGITPTRAVTPAEALNDVLREIGVAPTAASAAVAAPRPPAVHRVVTPGPRYGIGIADPEGGQPSLRIFEIDPGSIAARAGLQAGDRILTLNGTPVSQIPAGGLQPYMRASPLAVVVARGDEQLTFHMSLN